MTVPGRSQSVTEGDLWRWRRDRRPGIPRKLPAATSWRRRYSIPERGASHRSTHAASRNAARSPRVGQLGCGVEEAFFVRYSAKSTADNSAFKCSHRQVNATKLGDGISNDERLLSGQITIFQDTAGGRNMLASGRLAAQPGGNTPSRSWRHSITRGRWASMRYFGDSTRRHRLAEVSQHGRHRYCAESGKEDFRNSINAVPDTLNQRAVRQIAVRETRFSSWSRNRSEFRSTSDEQRFTQTLCTAEQGQTGSAT